MPRKRIQDRNPEEHKEWMQGPDRMRTDKVKPDKVQPHIDQDDSGPEDRIETG